MPAPWSDEPFDLLIEGGWVIDDTRAPRFDADVGLRAGRIVAPGFIDAHTHDDVALLTHPGMDFKAWQGVTTVVTGNCGISPAPLAPDTPTPQPISLAVGAGPHRFPSFAACLQALREAPAAVNAAPLLGHTTRSRGRPTGAAAPRRWRASARRCSASACRWTATPTPPASTPCWSMAWRCGRRVAPPASDRGGCSRGVGWRTDCRTWRVRNPV
jgi:hypothetical protein